LGEEKKNMEEKQIYWLKSKHDLFIDPSFHQVNSLCSVFSFCPDCRDSSAARFTSEQELITW